jgi:mRNA-degrading endonuclease RelE of RelBE toxin-antitoxin system
MVRIEITKKAHRQLGKLPAAESDAIDDAIDALASWPNCRNVKKLTDRAGYRLRVGAYRVFFQVEDGKVVITEVKKRNERTY